MSYPVEITQFYLVYFVASTNDFASYITWQKISIHFHFTNLCRDNALFTLISLRILPNYRLQFVSCRAAKYPKRLFFGKLPDFTRLHHITSYSWFCLTSKRRWSNTSTNLVLTWLVWKWTHLCCQLSSYFRFNGPSEIPAPIMHCICAWFTIFSSL